MQLFIHYYTSPIGLLHIQCTSHFFNQVSFCEQKGDTPGQEHELLQSCIMQLDEYFSGKRQAFALPLKQEGTVFQQKVWDLLAGIPFGKTMSYHQLSKLYGDVKAIRAVAAANGRNNLAIIIPCHRVIGTDHSLTGYGGGLWRKKWLLEHEARYCHGVQLLFE